MGRKAVLFGFWIVGYAVGVLAWFMRVPLLQFVENLGLGANVTEGLVAGLFGASVMVLSVLVWSFLSSS
jgi:hypothetical protein